MILFARPIDWWFIIYCHFKVQIVKDFNAHMNMISQVAILNNEWKK
jgi:hypothetical protein